MTHVHKTNKSIWQAIAAEFITYNRAVTWEALNKKWERKKLKSFRTTFVFFYYHYYYSNLLLIVTGVMCV